MNTTTTNTDDRIGASPERPLRDLTPAEVDEFQRDGVVCVRQVIPDHWLERVARAIERDIAAPTDVALMLSLPDQGYINDVFVWLGDDDLRAFVLESPAAVLAHQALGSSGVTFFYDQVFVKEPGTDVPTPWHHDLTFWPVAGEQLCSIWMPLDSVDRASSGLEYVRGSQRWPERFKAITPDYNAYMMESDLVDPPDIDAHRDEYDLVSWDMEPGDVLLFHPLVVHGSAGNTTRARRRRALATRWLGDDVTYAPRHATMPLPPGHGLEPGAPMGGPMFPRVIA
ncbi:MAG TPA: phytanoyl-CoA dioxygenase family protein [Acidimicrobiia bacterium]|nr:phytanoyl-CoA dioxygenase family protein [Acidimicrobiia bacterium]